MEHQKTGAGWLARQSRAAYFADEPGLGKTRTVLRALELAYPASKGNIASVVCPAVVIPHWYHEAQGMDVKVVVTSYDNAARYPNDVYPGGVLVLDEAHFLKHMDTKRYDALLAPMTGIAHRQKRPVWLVSGTPMPRNPFELFAPLSSLWPHILQGHGVETAQEFLDTFCRYKVGEYGPKIYGAKNQEKLQTILRHIMLRRKVVDVAPDLPPLRWGVLYIDGASNHIVALEDKIPRETMERIYAGDTDLLVDENLARYYHAVGDAKAPIVAEWLRQELDADPEAKFVVFAYHRSVMDTIQSELLVDTFVARIDGDTSPLDREVSVNLFRADPGTRIFLGQVKACATGLDGLQYASREVILVEPVWGTDVNVQAAHRVARIGQTLPAQARMIALAGTLDEAIVRNHHREVKMVREITG